MLIFHCEHCGKKLGAKESQAGRTVKCLKCQQPVIVRDESAQASTHQATPAVSPQRKASSLPQPIYGGPGPVPRAMPSRISAQPPQPVYQQPQYEEPQYEQPPAGVADQDPLLMAAMAAAHSETPTTSSSAAPGASRSKPSAGKRKPVKKSGNKSAMVIVLIVVIMAGAGIGAYVKWGMGPAEPPKDQAGALASGQIPLQGPRAEDGVIPLTGAPASDNVDWKIKLDVETIRKRDPKPKVANPLPPDEIFEKSGPSIGRVDIFESDGRKRGQGSGFFVSADGLAITNYHVVTDDDADLGSGEFFCDGKKYTVEGILAVDPIHDLALMKTSASNVPFLKVWDGEPPAIGSDVVAIGTPLSLDNTMSLGIISQLRKDGLGEVEMIQTSASIDHGSSGGALLSRDNVVIGVTAAGMESGANLNFAVPSKRVVELVKGPAKLQTIAELDKARKVGRGLNSNVLAKAMRMIMLGRADLAIALLGKVPPENRNNWSYWFTLGIAQQAKGDKTAAAKSLGEAKKNLPESADSWLMVGMAYAEISQTKEAEECIKKAIALNPNHPRARVALAAAYAKAGRTEDARKELNDIINSTASEDTKSVARTAIKSLDKSK